MNRIPLEKRLERVKTGYASDREYNACAVRSFAEIPIRVYLSAFGNEYARLLELLSITEEEAQDMTYRNVAAAVHRLFWMRGSRAKAAEAMRILALPFQQCQEERKKKYEQKNG